MDLDALERLGRLRAAGEIGEDEFEVEKLRILRRSPDSALTPPMAMPVSDSLYDDHEFTDSSNSGRRRRWPAIAIGTIALVTLAGFTGYEYFGPVHRSVSAIFDTSQKYAVRSKVAGIHVASVSELSQNPHGSDQSCSPYEKLAVGAAAKMVASAGWHVTSELRIGKLDAVSFVGSCSPLSESLFNAVDGNIAIYDGSALRAIIYGKGVEIVEASSNPDKLLIKDGPMGNILGKVSVGSRFISVRP